MGSWVNGGATQVKVAGFALRSFSGTWTNLSLGPGSQAAKSGSLTWGH